MVLRFQTSSVTAPSEDDADKPVGTLAVVDDPTGDPQDKNGKHQQRG
jgi:hypothetical protein